MTLAVAIRAGARCRTAVVSANCGLPGSGWPVAGAGFFAVIDERDDARIPLAPNEPRCYQSWCRGRNGRDGGVGRHDDLTVTPVDGSPGPGSGMSEPRVSRSSGSRRTEGIRIGFPRYLLLTAARRVRGELARIAAR